MVSIRSMAWLLALASSLAGMVACGGGGDGNSAGGDPDCAQAEQDWGSNKTQYLGDECWARSYGSCDVSYDDCLEGVCGNDGVCTKACSGDGGCGGMYCRDGFCVPAADCRTYCDGYMCCVYTNDPDDPTRCKQGSCY